MCVGGVSYKLAEEIVMEVAAENFRGFFLTLGPAVSGGPSRNLGGAVTMCFPRPDTFPGRVSHRAKCEKL